MDLGHLRTGHSHDSDVHTFYAVCTERRTGDFEDVGNAAAYSFDIGGSYGGGEVF